MKKLKEEEDKIADLTGFRIKFNIFEEPLALPMTPPTRDNIVGAESCCRLSPAGRKMPTVRAVQVGE